jgi:uncharacterized membrane protein
MEGHWPPNWVTLLRLVRWYTEQACGSAAVRYNGHKHIRIIRSLSSELVGWLVVCSFVRLFVNTMRHLGDSPTYLRATLDIRKCLYVVCRGSELLRQILGWQYGEERNVYHYRRFR